MMCTGGALLPGHGAHAGGGADAVHVGVLVAHDKHPGGVGHQLAQGVGHDPALDLGALLQLLGAAAVELKVELFLITAWSPPRLRAISTDRAAYWNSSANVSASLPTPMDRVAWMPEGLTTSRTVSRMENLPS